ncbi:beta-xylosidase [Deinococcus metalli]|uniref:Beta-xylosidase n=1 Tax=Deinococcus metalli TaxID=1141878 RepID=A0A7W8KH27_9DEIO|nr:glycoside hydrolase family 43 protein [Deinococcus metalli]MBB5378056.1 beta-xylosidase [Deinococcus metalli]GHF54082.1 endo-1,4-beta-xylanase [Deinococcus metalli]
MSRASIAPAHPGYFADPFVLRSGDRYYAYGTGLDGQQEPGGLAFEVLSSPDLRTWVSHGGSLVPVTDEPRAYWAPEVAERGGSFYMYYSVGIEDKGHHLRVAVSASPLGPFVDQGLNLTPDEPFAIDPHPFQDDDGAWYLYYARDDLTGERPGTVLAAQRLDDMTRLVGPPVPVLGASSEWQRYQRDRSMYGRVYDWHTLEGPFVVKRQGTYHLFYSGGAWTNETYGVGHAVADHPLGPWREPQEGPVVLASGLGGLRGPGHNSVVRDGQGQDHLVFHAWNALGTQRELHIEPLVWTSDGTPQLALG